MRPGTLGRTAIGTLAALGLLTISASAAPTEDSASGTAPGSASGTAPGSARETAAPNRTPQRAERLDLQMLQRYPHDTGAFTQGFELRGDVLYEGTGQYGDSELRKVEPETGEVLDSVALPDDEFGEGITLVGDSVWQLTWKAGIAYRRDADTLAVRDRAEYQGEGWGLCLDRSADRLVMSDGSDTLTFRDPETFEARGTVPVTLDGEPLDNLNELECVNGQVWANVWQTDRIVRIDPDSGHVTGVVDASGLLTEEEAASANVLNGIAYDEDSDTFLITGKLWPATFRVNFR